MTTTKTNSMLQHVTRSTTDVISEAAYKNILNTLKRPISIVQRKGIHQFNFVLDIETRGLYIFEHLQEGVAMEIPVRSYPSDLILTTQRTLENLSAYCRGILHRCTSTDEDLEYMSSFIPSTPAS